MRVEDLREQENVVEAVLFTIDSTTGKCIKAERVDLNFENSSQR